MKTVVDTSALLALLYPDDTHNRPAAGMLLKASERGSLVINPVVYAELAADTTFGADDELEYFLTDTGIDVESLSRDVAFRAGQAFETYLSRRGEELQCPSCGMDTTVDCPSCGNRISGRQHIAADFLIGAHAETADELLTFDHGFFRDYFDVTVRAIDD